jgi:hypothetical protein
MAGFGPCSVGALSLFALALLTSACATTSGPKGAGAADSQAQAPRDHSGDVISGEGSGLGITGAQTPPELKMVAAKPYAAPATVDCRSLDSEIAGLDAVLGPDVDILADPKASAALKQQGGHAFGSALRDAIPYRWALRWLTQAGDMDKQLREAVMAGAARRGFLKGMRLAMACPPYISAPSVSAGPAPGDAALQAARPTRGAVQEPSPRR